jgi:hemerythrin-like domain-containing protein
MNAAAITGPADTSGTPRQPRPTRAPGPALPAFEQLDFTHRAALEMLRSFDKLLNRLEDQGPDDAARHCARDILAFFNGPGSDHHAQEEKLVFPALLVTGEAELIQHIRRLQQDHGWIEEDWRELRPQIEAIADGFTWYELPMLRTALPVFTALYQEHIALEESLIYPAAKRQAQALQSSEAARHSGN